MSEPKPGVSSLDLEAETATYCQTVGHCLELWRAVAFPIAVSPSLDRTFRVGFPLVAHSLNHTEASLELRERLPLVAATSARVALEHALTAQWVLLTTGGPEHLVKHMQAGYLVRTKAFAEALGEDPSLTLHVPEEYLRTLNEVAGQEPAPGKEREWSMERLFDRFSGTSLFYDLYRELSGAVHPSYSTIQAHLNVHEGGDRVHKQGLNHLTHSTAQATALASVLAIDFVERCQENPPTPSPVAVIASAAGLPRDLAFSDQTPNLQPSRTQPPT